eukprot:scaffold143_cov260-Pinguiococcus_pyrenoidosus.AAC.54
MESKKNYTLANQARCHQFGAKPLVRTIFPVQSAVSALSRGAKILRALWIPRESPKDVDERKNHVQDAPTPWILSSEASRCLLVESALRELSSLAFFSSS